MAASRLGPALEDVGGGNSLPCVLPACAGATVSGSWRRPGHTALRAQGTKRLPAFIRAPGFERAYVPRAPFSSLPGAASGRMATALKISSGYLPGWFQRDP